MDQLCFMVDNLNVAYSSPSTVLWNKFQIFLTEEQELQNRSGQLPNWSFVYNTDFEIHRLILANDIIYCLDNKGDLYVLKQPLANAHKRPRQGFQKLNDNILCMEVHNNLLFTIKSEINELSLQIYKKLKICAIYKFEKHDFQQLLNEIKNEKCLLHCYKINETDFDSVNKIFKIKEIASGEKYLLNFSFDKLTLYAILVDLQRQTSPNSHLTPIKLLTCPSDINSVLVIKESNLNLLTSLSAGTLIKQPLNNNYNTYKIAHLNTAIHKCAVVNDKIIYTDGNTMWVSKNAFSVSESMLRQFFVKNVKDFAQTASTGNIICTTFSKLVYVLNITDESCYLAPVSDTQYNDAEHLLSNVKYLNKIIEEVETNDEIIKNIKKEEHYIKALALSNRQDIINKMLHFRIFVYENYEDILEEGLKLNLTNNLTDYFEKDSFMFLIKMSTASQQTFDSVLANIFADSKIHITIISDQSIIKTISIKVTDQLKSFNIVVPLRMNRLNITDVNFDIKLVKKVPKVLNCAQNLWVVLYFKQVTLTPEYFIKTNSFSNVRLLKDPEDSLENLIYRTAHKLHGHLFRITKSSEDIWMWQFYFKMPSEEILRNEVLYKEQLGSTKAKFLLKLVFSEEFLHSRKPISFIVFSKKLDMEILDDGFSNDSRSKIIKVACANPVLALGIRNFFSNLLHKNQEIESRHLFVNCRKIPFEISEKAVKRCTDEKLSFEEFFKVYEQFQKTLCETLV